MERVSNQNMKIEFLLKFSQPISEYFFFLIKISEYIGIFSEYKKYRISNFSDKYRCFSIILLEHGKINIRAIEKTFHHSDINMKKILHETFWKVRTNNTSSNYILNQLWSFLNIHRFTQNFSRRQKRSISYYFIQRWGKILTRLKKEEKNMTNYD